MKALEHLHNRRIQAASRCPLSVSKEAAYAGSDQSGNIMALSCCHVLDFFLAIHFARKWNYKPIGANALAFLIRRVELTSKA